MTGGEFSSPGMVARVKSIFRFHPADSQTQIHHQSVRSEHETLALWIERNVPPCPERDQAIQSLAASMWACNSAVAQHHTRRREIHEGQVEAARNV